MTEPRRPNKLTRRTVLGAMVMAPMAGAAVPLIRAAAATDPASVGQWSAPFSIGGIAIHATLLHNDDILFFQYPEGSAATDHTSYIATWNWRTNVTREAPVTFNRDIFCSVTASSPTAGCSSPVVTRTPRQEAGPGRRRRHMRVQPDHSYLDRDSLPR